MQFGADANAYVPSTVQFMHAVDCTGAYVASPHATGTCDAFAQENPAGQMSQELELPSAYDPGVQATGS